MTNFRLNVRKSYRSLSDSVRFARIWRPLESALGRVLQLGKRTILPTFQLLGIWAYARPPSVFFP